MAARLGGAAAQALLLFILARQMQPEEFALAMGVLGVLTFLSAVSDLGITPATTRETAAGRDATRLAHVNRLVAVSATLACAALIVGAYFLAGADVLWLEMLPFALWLFFERVSEFRFARSLGAGHTGAAAANLFVRRAMPVLVVACGFFANMSPLLLLSVGYALAAGLSTLVGREPPAVDGPSEGATTRGALRLSLPFWVNSIAAQSRQLDVLLLSLVSPVAVAALYAPAGRLIGPLRLIPSTLAQAALPIIARSGRAAKGPWKMVALASAVSFAAYSVVAVFAEPLVRFLFGQNYAGAGVVLQILLAGLLFASGASVLGSYLQGTSREWVLARISVGCAVLALLGVAVGATVAGAVGTAIGLSAAYVFQFLLAAWIVARHTKGRGSS